MMRHLIRKVRLSKGNTIYYGKTIQPPTEGEGFHLVMRSRGGFRLLALPKVDKVLSENLGDYYFRIGQDIYLAKLYPCSAS